MPSNAERRGFYLAVALVLLVPTVVGPIGGFGGLEAMARVLGAHARIEAPLALRSGLRAIVFLFFALVPLVIWSLSRLRERAGAFQIVLLCGFIAGFARLTGYFREGYGGALSLVFLVTELIGMPALFIWHRRLASRADHKAVPPTNSRS